MARIVNPLVWKRQVSAGVGVSTPANPLSSAVGEPAGILKRIQIRIPPGHAGQTGIRVTLSGQQILPYNPIPQWLIGDDQTFDADFNLEVGGSLTTVIYNLGNFLHQWYVLFTITAGLPDQAVSSAAQPVALDLSQLQP